MKRKGRDPGKSVGNSNHTAQAAARPADQTDGAVFDERVRLRAYELYVERGDQPGDRVADWLQAERECRGGS